ncbi:MAG: endo alpha-1,4 polygalactosaminidase, partial [Myxococcales bacterium]|nr:endo alpha-1,4 polygalactosaminidase [Myxococcales bacterium]
MFRILVIVHALMCGVAARVEALPVAAAAPAALPGPSIAFYYGASLPIAELSQFDRVVIDPDRATADELSALRAAGVETFAYVSVGELDPARAWSRGADASWRLGRNAAWKTAVMDPRQPGWRALVLAELARLWAAGHRGFFFDTLDSYAAVLPREADRRACAAALSALITEAHARYATAKLLINRGFELLPAVAPLVAGVVAESMFASWDARAGRYVAVGDADRRWLAAKLAEVSARDRLPVT